MQPDLNEVRRLSEQGNVIPVHESVPADLLTPVSAFLKLRQGGRHPFLLESIEGGEKLARYSFLGCDPFLILTVGSGQAGREDAAGGCEHRHYPKSDRLGFFTDLRQTMARYRSVQVPGLPPFTGGAVGYFGYDMVRLVEDIPETGIDDVGLNDAAMLLFRTVLAFDHLKNQIHIVSNLILQDVDSGEKGPSLESLCREAEAVIGETRRKLTGPLELPASAAMAGQGVHPESNFAKDAYLTAVEAAKDYIVAGDIFQVVLSQRFGVDLPAEPFEVYRALRMVNPSPYMYFLDVPGASIVGASPEMLVQIRGRAASYRPIAGTRPRGEDEASDRALAEELMADAKERAEHVMLVDLGRNDLGRVCRYGTVRVADFMFIERYSHVMHLVSALEGELRDDVDRFDALMACFPAGTVSGAPKVRAMEIIDEREPTRRGVYAGAILYADFSGNLDSCIAIRTLVARGGKGYIQAGGGIVADSVPEREYEETVNKAQALVRALELASRGLAE
jgi:anthranilate synthase component I